MGYFIIRLLSALFGVLPFSVVHRISNFLAFVLYRVVGYRKKVVFTQLRHSFPSKSAEEIEKIAKESYLNIADLMVESLKSLTMTAQEIADRYPIHGAEIVKKFQDEDRTVFIVSGHVNNWEWLAAAIPAVVQPKFIVIFKPVKDKKVMDYLTRIRTAGGTYLVPMRETYDHIEQHKHEANSYGFMADQSPSNTKNLLWADFFGRKTACLPGMDVLARKYNYPVVYLDVKRTGRSCYAGEFSLICDNSADLPEGEIMQRYTSRVEQTIIEQPGSWLWSHKRWKHALKDGEVVGNGDFYR